MRALTAAFVLAVFSSVTVDLVCAVDPVVDVGYTKYRGTALNGVTQWLGMRYASPPLGNLRFRAPADPPVNDTIQDANTHGKVCLSTGSKYSATGKQEDCLFLEIFAPSNATADSKLPVMFFIQGGGLNILSNSNYNGSELIHAADMDMVIVTHNYRVGPYGFLASKEVQADGDINAGLLDQRKALQWVHDNISKFGGDPGHVTLAGDSAGAQSITLHLTAFGGAPTELFHAVIGESQSFPPTLTVSEAQFEYDALVERVGCSNKTDTLSCLRALDIKISQNNNTVIPFPGRNNTPNYLYNAIVDGDFLPELPYTLFEQGKFVKVPSVFGDDTNEGTKFTTEDLNNTSEMDDFLADNFPDLNETMFKILNDLYPKGEQFSDHGEYYSAAAAAYGEIRYICPGIYISNHIRNARSPLPNWMYRYNVEDPDQVAAGLGVPHTVEVPAIWGLNSTTSDPPASYFTTNRAIVPVMQGFWTSFIRTFDPNMHRADGTPEWQSFDGKQRILFETNATRMETISSDQQERCDYLTSIAVVLKQ